MKIRSFQGLRYYFAVLIVLNHMNFLDQSEPTRKIFEHIFHNGGFSVTFFFLLSGFCISIGYGGQYKAATIHDCISFTKKRLSKLYPAYAFSMILAFLYRVITYESKKGIIKALFSLILSLSLCQTLTVKYWGVLNSACWFISCIVVLYSITPFLLSLVATMRPLSMINVTIVDYIIIIIVTIVVDTMKANDWSHLFVYVTPYFRFFYYFLGIVAGRIFLQYRSAFEGLNKVKASLMEISSLVLAIVIYFWGIHYGIDKASTNILYIPILIFIILAFSSDLGGLSKFLGNKIHQYLGMLSTYIYIFHYVIIHFGGKQILDKLLGRSVAALVMTAIILFITIHIISTIMCRVLPYCHRQKNSRVLEYDLTHGRYLDILEKKEISFLQGYNIKHLLYNECFYVQTISALFFLRAIVKNVFNPQKLNCISKGNSEILFFSIAYDRHDHDEYWCQFKDLFYQYTDIYLQRESIKQAICINMTNMRKRIKRLSAIYRELNLIPSKKDRLFLSSRLQELCCIEEDLDAININPKVAICFFDGEYHSNFVMQYYKKHGAITVTNQHGQPIIHSVLEDRMNQSQILNFTCDYFIAKGEFTKNQFINAGFESGRIVVLGGIDNCTNQKMDFTEKRRFGVFLDCPNRPFARNINQFLVNMAEEIGESIGYRYILKLHPLDKKSNYGRSPKKRCEKIILQETSLNDIFSDIDFGIMHASAIYVDMLSYGIKAYKYKSNVYFPIVEEDQNQFSSFDELIDNYRGWRRLTEKEKRKIMEESKRQYNNNENSDIRIKRFIYHLCQIPDTIAKLTINSRCSE